MYPKINIGDLVLFYRLENTYESEEVVIIKKDNKTYIGRIIGLPNDTIDITDDNELKINGNIVLESDIFYETNKFEGYKNYPINLKDDEYFILGDNRPNSLDSRTFGPLNKNDIKGKIITLIRRNNI